jgi:hypothetical protein
VGKQVDSLRRVYLFTYLLVYVFTPTCAIITPVPILEIRLGDVVKLRKPHPCGGSEWQVDRLGADIGMVCATCGRRVLLPRSEFEKRVKMFVKRGEPNSLEQNE